MRLGVPLKTAMFATACVLAMAPVASAAEAKTSSLSWLRMPGADSCIATQPLARAVEERLGRETFVSAAQADLSVEGRIEKKKKGGWHAVITMRDPKGALLGTREVDRDDASCDAMSEPLALIIAVMIDPDAATRPKPEPAKPDPTPPPTATAPVQPPPPIVAPPPSPPKEEPAKPEPKKDPWRIEAGGHAMVLGGLLPELGWGAGVSGILFPPGIPLGFRGVSTLFLPTTAEGNGKSVEMDTLMFGGFVCPTVRRRVNVMACLGGHSGIIRPRVGDIIPIWNAAAELRVSIPIVQPVMVGAGAAAGVPIFRPKYEDIYKSDVVVFTGDFMIGFFFP